MSSPKASAAAPEATPPIKQEIKEEEVETSSASFTPINGSALEGSKDVNVPVLEDSKNVNAPALEDSKNVNVPALEDSKDVTMSAPEDSKDAAMSAPEDSQDVTTPALEDSKDLNTPKLEDSKDANMLTPEGPKDATTPCKRPAQDVDEDFPKPAKRTKGRATPEPTGETPRQRKAPKKAINAPKAIGNTLEDLDPLDRKMIEMKDEGKGWKEIGEMWLKATGEKTAKSTLPNRYARIKANIMTMPEDEQRKLTEAVVWVQEDYEKTKWERISQRMQEQGVENRYPLSILQKQYQKMLAAAAAVEAKVGSPE